MHAASATPKAAQVMLGRRLPGLGITGPLGVRKEQELVWLTARL